MKKLSVVIKETSENRIRKTLEESQAYFVVKYSKLSGPDLNALRKSLRGINSELFVVRNNVARRALKDSGNTGVLDLIAGPCGLVFSKKEPVETSKVLYNFIKNHENLKVEGGLFKDRLLSKKDFESLAKLPSRDVLIAQSVMVIKSPLSGLVTVLQGNLRKLVQCLDQIKGKKQ